MSKKSRRKYEDSESDEDIEDRRSVFSHNDRSERKSTSGRYNERPRVLRDGASLPRELPRRFQNQNAKPDIFDRSSDTDRSKETRHNTTKQSKKQSLKPQKHESSSELESESHESDIFEEEEEEQALQSPPIITDEAPTAVVPSGNWECEHCTFVNDAGTKVCLVCCKTASANVKIVANDDNTNGTTNTKLKKPIALKASSSRGKSSDEYSARDLSETESMLQKVEVLKLDDKLERSSTSSKLKGRPSRKISFWPGTKLQK